MNNKSKYQIALDNILLDINEGVIYSTDLERLIKDLKTLGELVDKATPKKVTCGWCPTCHAHIEIDLPFPYDCCRFCGQRLEYEDEKNI